MVKYVLQTPNDSTVAIVTLISYEDTNRIISDHNWYHIIEYIKHIQSNNNDVDICNSIKSLYSRLDSLEILTNSDEPIRHALSHSIRDICKEFNLKYMTTK